MEYRDTWGQFHLMLLTHTGTSIWVDISWHHYEHIIKPVASGTQGQGLALHGLSWMLYLGAARKEQGEEWDQLPPCCGC